MPTRIEHLLAIEGMPPVKSEDPSAGSGQGPYKVPPGLLEEVFELNEQLDEIRESRETGSDAAALSARLREARKPIDAKREAHEQQLDALAARWDANAESGSPDERRAILEALRERLLERNYINNLLATIEREAKSLETGA